MEIYSVCTSEVSLSYTKYTISLFGLIKSQDIVFHDWEFTAKTTIIHVVVMNRYNRSC